MNYIFVFLGNVTPFPGMAGQMDCDDSMMDAAETARDSSTSKSKRKSADLVDGKPGRSQPRTKKPRMDGDDGQTGDETSTDTEANRRRGDKTKKAAARMSRIPREGERVSSAGTRGISANIAGLKSSNTHTQSHNPVMI